MAVLLLKRASTSRTSGEWNEDDYADRPGQAARSRRRGHRMKRREFIMVLGGSSQTSTRNEK